MRTSCLALLATAVFAGASAHAGSSTPKSGEEITISKAASSEQQDREVDQVALGAQDIAISRLKGLLKKYTNTSQEPVFLAKLADIQQQKAAIQFRVAHGLAAHSRKALDLSAHHKTMQASIATLNRLLAAYPDYEDIPHAYFLRGKAYEEIEDKARAGADYLKLVQLFPNCEDSTPAYMSLADFAIDANNHPLALTYLKAVEKRPQDPHYPFALYKMAWSYYNLKAIPDALSYAERQITYYNDRGKRSESGQLSESDAALRENTLLDTTVFYFEGYEENVKAYELGNALDYFKRLEDGPALGKMFLRFAKLLRSHSHETDLMEWKRQLLASQSRFPESLDVVILTYEFELNQHKYPQVVDCARDMVALFAQHRDYESFPKAQKQVQDTAESLQALIVKNKGATEVGQYSHVLAQLYDSFVHMMDEKDPRIPRAHYNLAETLFTIQDFDGATTHYRWIVEHNRWPEPGGSDRTRDSKDKNEAGITDSSLKAIASRYEILVAKNLIPKELKPRELPSKDKSEVDPLLAEWVDWLDTHVKHSLDGTENFVFESNRALYEQGQVRRAVERMASFSAKHPKSTYAVPQASLVLDTYIASQDWEKTHDTARDFLDVPEWKTGAFAKKLFAVASDAFYKMTEAKFRARDYKGALSGCDKFLERYSASARLGDILALAGSAALEDEDDIGRRRAMGYFTRLIAETPGSANAPMALLARASNEEDHYLFPAAARDYRAYVARMSQDTQGKDVDQKKLSELRRKALMLTWLSGDRAELTAALAEKTLCVDKVADDCQRLSILSSFETSGELSADPAGAFDKARRDSAGDNRPLYALLALEGTDKLSFHDRNEAVTMAAKGFDGLDPLVKFYLLPRLEKDLIATFRLNRAALNDVAPLKSNREKGHDVAWWIKKRVEAIHEMEDAATVAMKLPWSRARAEVLSEMASVYLDLSHGLAALTPPKGLSAEDQQAYDDTIRKITLPFEDKGQDMRGKAFEIATRFSIEEDSFWAIAEPFFADNPSQAKAFLGKNAPPKITVRAPGSSATRETASAAAVAATPAKAPALDLAFLSRLDPDGGWGALIKHPERPITEQLAYDNPALYLKSLWARAVQGKRLQQIAFFMQEAQEKALIQAGIMGAVKAVSLAAVGARGEGLAELEDARRDLTPEGQSLASEVRGPYDLSRLKSVN